MGVLALNRPFVFMRVWLSTGLSLFGSKTRLQEAIMLAYGFKTELLIELINAGFATTSIERMVAGGRRIEVTRMRITAAGRRALSKLRWP